MADGSTLELDFRKRRALDIRNGSIASINWNWVQLTSAPTFASDEFELQIFVAAIGVKVGETLSIEFEGSDSLQKPINVKMIGNSNLKLRGVIDLSKKADSSIRVASLNTLHQGVADPNRRQLIAQIIRAADPDVVCFNEEWDEKPFREHVGKVLPAAGSRWDVHWSRSRGIAARVKLEPVAMECPNATAAYAKSRGGKKVAVVSVHFDCCGHIGSDEDKRRVEQAKLLVRDVRKQLTNQPVVALGDFNLVGSREPLDRLNAIGLKDVLLRSPLDGSTNTWAGMKDSEPFWPGRLDYATVRGMDVSAGFVLHLAHAMDTASPDLLEQIEEMEADYASDHSMIVVDVAVE